MLIRLAVRNIISKTARRGGLLCLGAALLAACGSIPAYGLGEKRVVTFRAEPGGITLADSHHAATLLVDSGDWFGVLRAADDFRGDIESVTGKRPPKTTSISANMPDTVIVGTLGHNRFIDELAKDGKIDASAIRGQWEAALITVVDRPMPNINRALVIAGSDKRGTIFALYTLSEQIGVSPWAWWADVRIPHHDSLYVSAGEDILPPPAVRYRGIFLNDEAPSLSGWAKEKFGGFNHKFYEHVFELLLRLRANYLWPAMWGSAFNEDDPFNPKLADEYGIVMGTSHHEPMLRAQQEWKRHGKGPWDYTTNAAELNRFWTEGIKRNREYESTITVGMRGDGDMAMSPSVNTSLLEKIVTDQRQIIAANEDPSKHDPEIWALYKEVQDYYDKGMRVPDDVTLLWSDDNWGNLRRLPTAEERKRSGGAGIYYHFDYVGGPRSYKWLNTISITKIWEQMHLAATYGADRVWIVNVGDLKPMEFPTEFFLTMARNPNRWGRDDLDAYTLAWATREFGPEHAAEIAHLVELYTKYNTRRKPELLDPATYSFTGDHEADRIEAAWKMLADEADRIGLQLPKDERASYFELVQYPVDACANLGEMYIDAGRNRLYAREHRASANFWADRTQRLFAHDAELSRDYNAQLNGKWNHMMDQTHIGYKHWNDPPVNTMPDVEHVDITAGKHLGIFPENAAGMSNELPPFDSVNRQVYTIDLARTGSEPVSARLTPTEPWVQLSWAAGTITDDKTVQVSIDWSHVPQGAAEAAIRVSAEDGSDASIKLRVLPIPEGALGFVEDAGTVTIDAAHTTSRASANGVAWQTIPGFGLTLSGIESFPVTAESTPPGEQQACADYDFTLLETGSWTLQTILAPTLSFLPSHGLRYSNQIDHEPPETVDVWAAYSERAWEETVRDGVHRVSTPLGALSIGPHAIRVCRIDPGVVLERLLIFKSQPPEYLGPTESAEVRKRPTPGNRTGE